MPAVDAVAVTVTPSTLNTTPGAAVTTVLGFTNVGNENESHITLTDTLAAGLGLTGLAPVSLPVGKSTTETITLTPASLTPLNSTLVGTVTASFGPAGSPITETVTIPVHVVIPGAAGIADAAVAAAQDGDTELGSRLGDLSTAVTNLVESPTSGVENSEALAAIRAIVGLIAPDPFLSPLIPALDADGAALARANTAATVQAATTQLGNDLTSVATILADEAAHSFTLAFVSNSQTAQPQVATDYQVVLQNTGSQATTYDLSLSGLPSGVTGSITPLTITLQPGQVTPGSQGVPAITVSLTSTSAVALDPFSFTVTAAAQGASEIKQSILGQFTARPAFVQVTSITTNPPFANPGTAVDVTAQILNAVNQQQQAEVSYVVTGPNGKTVFSSQPVTAALNVLTTLTPVDLGHLATTGFALGEYTITVTIADGSGKPIPGATGQGSLLIGTPVTATLTSTPATLPAGNGTVTEDLQLNSQLSYSPPLTLTSTTAIAGAQSVAIDGTLAYVGIAGGIDIVDISDPAKPKVLSTFGTGDMPSGAGVYLQVDNNELVVREPDERTSIVHPHLLAGQPEEPDASRQDQRHLQLDQ